MSKVFRRPFLKLTIHENRIEIVEGMIPFRKRQTIPFKNIANVEVSKFTKQLIITTNDGKERRFVFSGFGTAQAAREAIAEKL